MIRSAAFVIALLSAGSSYAQSRAPFCLVDAAGTRCWYYSMDACRRDAGQTGACVVNQQRDQQSAPSSNLWENLDRSYRAGREARRDREQASPPSTYTSGQNARTWRTFCGRMLDHDMQLLSSFSARMTQDEFNAAANSYVARATYCESLAGSTP